MVFTRKMGPDGKRRRFSPLLWLASLLAILALILGITGTLSQLEASITNDNNNVAVGAPSFAFSESNNSNNRNDHCVTAGEGQHKTCTVINKYGLNGAVDSGVLEADSSRSTVVTLKNEASDTSGTGIAGDLHLVVDGCTQAPVQPTQPLPGTATLAGDLCASGTAGLSVRVSCSTTGTGPGFSFGPASLDTFAAAAPGGSFLVETNLLPQASIECTFTVTTASPLPPNLAGLTARQQLTWVWVPVGGTV